MQTLADAARDAVPIIIGYVTLGLEAGGLGLAIGGSAALLTALVTLAVGLVGLYAWRTRRPGAPGPQPRRRAG